VVARTQKEETPGDSRCPRDSSIEQKSFYTEAFPRGRFSKQYYDLKYS
jgi:hypothetical protein